MTNTIYAISDMHGDLPTEPCPPCDLLIIAGDLCPAMPHVLPIAVDQSRWLDRTFRPWLEMQPARTIVATWGNHDFVGKQPRLVPKDLPCTLVVDELVTVDGLRVYLTPWVPNLGRWAFAYDEDVPARTRSRIPYPLDILVSHGPPLGLLDKVRNGDHVGSATLLSACAKRKPPIIICGHIHESRGVAPTPWGGLIYNVSSLDRNYERYAVPYTLIGRP